MGRFTSPFGEPRRNSTAALITIRRQAPPITDSYGTGDRRPGGAQDTTSIDQYFEPSPVASLSPATAVARRLAGLDKMVTCKMCMQPFPSSTLKGRISYKAIVEQRARWGVLQLRERDIAAGILYQSHRVCVFCAQFFDEEVMALDDGDGDRDRAASSSNPALNISGGIDTVTNLNGTATRLSAPAAETRDLLWYIEAALTDTPPATTPTSAATDCDFDNVSRPTTPLSDRRSQQQRPLSPCAAPVRSPFSLQPRVCGTTSAPPSQRPHAVSDRPAPSFAAECRLQANFARKVLLEVAAARRKASSAAQRRATPQLEYWIDDDEAHRRPSSILGAVRDFEASRRRRTQVLLERREARRQSAAAIEPSTSLRRGKVSLGHLPS